MVSNDDAKALVTHLRTLACTCGFPRITEAARVIEQQAARIAELEAEVSKLKRCVRVAVDCHGVPTDLMVAILGGVPI